MGRASSTTLMRGGLATGATAVFGGAVIAISGGFTTLLKMLPTSASPAWTALRSPPATPLATPPFPAIAGTSSVRVAAMNGILVGAIKVANINCDGRGTAVLGRIIVLPGGGGAGGGPGASMPVIQAARGNAAGQIIGATTAQVTSSACPVTPAKVPQTRFDSCP